MEGRGKEGQDPKTGLKMEEKKLQALWTNTNNIAIHQTVIVLAPSQLFQKLISSSHLAPYFLALIEVDFRSQPMRKSPSVSFPFHSFISHSIPSDLPGRPCIPAKPATPLLSHPPLTLLSISRGLRSRRHPLSLTLQSVLRLSSGICHAQTASPFPAVAVATARCPLGRRRGKRHFTPNSR